MDLEKIKIEIAALKNKLQLIRNEADESLLRLNELNNYISDSEKVSEPDYIPQVEPEEEPIIPEEDPIAPEKEEEQEDVNIAPADPELIPINSRKTEVYIPEVAAVPELKEEQSQDKAQADQPQAAPPKAPPIKEARPNINEKLAEKKIKTPVENFADSPIADLKKAFSLNQKLAIIKHLFNDDADLYNQTIHQVNEAKTFSHAESILDQMVNPKNEDVHQEFMGYIKRRFI